MPSIVKRDQVTRHPAKTLQAFAEHAFLASVSSLAIEVHVDQYIVASSGQ